MPGIEMNRNPTSRSALVAYSNDRNCPHSLTPIDRLTERILVAGEHSMAYPANSDLSLAYGRVRYVGHFQEGLSCCTGKNPDRADGRKEDGAEEFGPGIAFAYETIDPKNGANLPLTYT